MSDQSNQTDRIIVRRAKVIDNIHRQQMAVKIADLVSDEMDAAAWEWLGFVTRTDYVPEYKLPTENDTGKAIFEQFELYLQMDAALAEEWGVLVAEANRPVSDHKLQPPQHLSEEEKKDTPVSEAVSANT